MQLRMMKYLRPLRGGSCPRLMSSDKDDLYVVKLLGNPQGNRVLANELLAGRLGALAGLPVPELHEVVLDKQVADDIRTGREGSDVGLGPHLASKYPVSILHGRVYDCIPRAATLESPRDIVGAAVFDAWTGNTDNRQFVYWRRSQDKRYKILMIDNGFCFGGVGWNLRHRPLDPACQLALLPELRLLTASADMVSVNQMLADWMAAISRIQPSDIRVALSNVPQEWNAAASDLKILAERLIERKEMLGRNKVLNNVICAESRSYRNNLFSRYNSDFWHSYRCIGESRQ